eukprot:gb/GEZN01000481.1/.p1 GENE.gb/GEZN01000481.1/~~gb/GEZN01000481.1/.p1  ORF type:complete len:1432 (+),score=288.38 gb/GEZN01000481.1/:25-4296(+)
MMMMGGEGMVGDSMEMEQSGGWEQVASDMERSGGWQQVALSDANSRSRMGGLSALCFDPFQELVWAGTKDGRIAAFHRTNQLDVQTGLWQLNKHVVFQAHTSPKKQTSSSKAMATKKGADEGSTPGQTKNPVALLSLLPLSNAVFSVSPSWARLHTRGGLHLSSLRPQSVVAKLQGVGSHNEQDSVLVDLTCAAACGLIPESPSVMLGAASTAGRPSLGMLDMVTNEMVRCVWAREEGGARLNCMVAPLDADSRAVLVCGNSVGQVELRDPRSLEPISSSTSSCVSSLAHPAGVTSLSLRGDLLVTCGLSARAGRSSPDSLLKVYDLRMLRGSSGGWELSQLRAIVFRPGPGGDGVAGPIAVQFMPKFSSSLAVLGAQGALQVLDAHSGTSSAWLQVQSASSPMHHAGGWQASCLAVSSSGAILAVGDTNGHLHQFANVPGQAELLLASPYNEYSEPLVCPAFGFATPNTTEQAVQPRCPPCSATELSFQETSCLALPPWPVDASHGPHALLSYWDSPSLASALPLPPLDPTLVPGLTWVDFIGSSLTPPADFLPNHLPSVAKFCSKRDLGSHVRSKHKATRSFIQLLTSPERRQMQVRREYAKVSITVPKFGLSEFDFSKYNQTSLCGLSNLLPNCYCNVALQLFYWTPGLRRTMLQHPATLCRRDPCLSCELGFLFHNMDLARGNTVEPRNFLRVLKQVPEAAALGLLDPVEPSSELMLAVKVQDLLRFLLHQLRLEAALPDQPRATERPTQPHPKKHHKQQDRLGADAAEGGSSIALEFGAEMEQRTHCKGGNHDTIDTSQELHFKLQYPGQQDGRAKEEEGGGPSFCSVLERSLTSTEPERRVWCPKCSKYQLTVQTRRLTQLPANLLLLGNVDSDAQLSLWRTELPSLPSKPENTMDKPPSSSQQALSSSDSSSFSCSTSSSSSSTSNAQDLSYLHTDKLERPDQRSWLPLFLRLSLPSLASGSVSATRYRGPLPGHPEWPAQASAHRDKSKPTQKTTPSSPNSSALAEGTGGESALYALSAVVAHVADPPEESSALSSVQGEHLVLHTAALQLRQQTQPTSSQAQQGERKVFRTDLEAGVACWEQLKRWYLINDFVIAPSTAREAANFWYLWKQPCVLKYTRIDLPLPEVIVASASDTGKRAVVSVAESGWRPIPPEVLFQVPEKAGGGGRGGGRGTKEQAAALAAAQKAALTFLPLSSGRAGDRIGRGTLVAIDCEFVVVQLEEKEERVDGKVTMVRPQRMQLARVSVVRGQGPQLGLPFIDQYILPTEPVVDHLTQWSGLHPGDLDPAVSPHHLVTLKQAFIRLRALADLGAVFVGHGLKKDFQMINMVVPANQIVDTVHLFYLPAKRRKLGLKFLAAHVLGVDVQRGTHDSIEDAHTALALFQRYQAMRRQGPEHVEQVLTRLYDAGAACGFKL